MKQPGQNIKFGHPGVGSFGHLAEVLIVQELGMKVTQVPYRGAGPANRLDTCGAARVASRG